MVSKIGSFTVEVLDFLLGLPESILMSFDQKEFYRTMRDYDGSKSLTVENICKLFHNLKRSGYIEVRRGTNNQESVIFTSKAKISIIDRLVMNCKSDGKYRLVSFDIPEIMRTNRNQFRRAIKRMGFKQIQKSLWVCDRNVGELVELAAKEYHVEEYVAYFIADKSNIDQEISRIIHG